MCKPFDFDELEARIRAIRRRETSQKSPVIETNGILLNTVTREVITNGKKIELTPTEYHLLEFFIANLASY